VELDALANMSPEERDALIERAAAGEQVSARPGPHKADMAANNESQETASTGNINGNSTRCPTCGQELPRADRR
jgi:hypothetical protein